MVKTTEGTSRHDISTARRAAAWGVHLITTSGAVICLLALRAAAVARWQEAFAWLVVAVIIDGIDGALARWVRVKEVLPGFDGALLDNIVDYASYVFVPAYILCRSDLLPPELSLVSAGVVCVASAYQFCRADAKTTDHYFTGFPSYWNVVALYVMALRLDQTVNLVIVAVCIVLVFVPIRYVYPTRTPRFMTLTLVLSAIWAALLIAILWYFPEPSPYLVWPSLAYVAYYVGLSLYLMAGRRRAA